MFFMFKYVFTIMKEYFVEQLFLNASECKIQ